jgi:hypothetical protein
VEDHLWFLLCYKVRCKIERLPIWSRGCFLRVTFADLLDGSFIVAIDLGRFVTFCCGFGCGCCCFSADAKLMGENNADRT